MPNNKPEPCIVDTNVALVANSKSSMSLQCKLNCVQALRDIQNDGHLVIDSLWQIIGEYQHQLSSSGQPGVGDAFLKWVLSNQANPQRITRVVITPIANSPDGCDFAEFPNAPNLAQFDRSDRKFVATACAHPQKPSILQASDSKWWGWSKALQKIGIEVQFLCQDELKAIYQQKMKDDG